MNFLQAVFLALVVMLVGAAMSGFVPLISWALGLVIIFLQALAARRRALAGGSNFDLLGASEIIVVYGILGLLTNLGIGVLLARPLLTGGADVFSDPKVLEPLLTRFGEGLLEAGVAPFAAVVLRQIEIHSGPKKLADVLVDPAALEEGFRRLELTLKGLNDELDKSVNRFSTGSARMAEAAAKMSGPLDAALTQLEAFKATLENVATNALAAGEATRGMGLQAKDASALLAELSKVIASVRNFIRADSA